MSSPAEPAAAGVTRPQPRLFDTTRPAVVAVAVLVGAGVLAQIAYPLVTGTTRDHVSVTIVALFAAAAIFHAGVYRGVRGLAAIVAIFVIGYGSELVGVRFGFPYGEYRYTGGLGVQFGGVPIVIGLAWIMLGWPAALVARRLVTAVPARVAVGAWALASWDLFLDPQMVADGHWRWTNASPHLPGVETVPLSNYGGWLLVALVVSLTVQLVLGGSESRGDGWMFAVYLWTFYSSVLAQLAFLDLPSAAGWGALGMGLIAVPLTWRLWVEWRLRVDR